MERKIDEEEQARKEAEAKQARHKAAVNTVVK
jgi:hypothetical protein